MILPGITAGRSAASSPAAGSPPALGSSTPLGSPPALGSFPALAAPAVCAWLLAGLGATLTTAGYEIRPARLVPSTIPLPEQGLPPGTLAYATGVVLAAAALAGWLAGKPFEVSETAVAIQVRLPEVMAASYRSPKSLRPPPPLAAPGGGWLAADLGTPADRDSFGILLGTLDAGATAGEVARAAQEWRLPVCDYRPRPARPASSFPISAPVSAESSLPAPAARIAADASPGAVPSPGAAPSLGAAPSPDGAPSLGASSLGAISSGAPPQGTGPLSGVSVCDLTAMWAGPLCTWLLAALGATVHKVEPPFRPDGMRALDGSGIHPRGRQVDPGRDSAMWNALNNGKLISPLDLRHTADRAAFTALAGSCDVVIDSFSPRVMPNFGLTAEVASGPGRPVMVSMPAFPPGPRRDWVAYGTGVHAVLGLGDAGDGTFEAPAVSYPDPLAGLTAALAVLASLVARRLGHGPRRVEVALESASRPLLRAGLTAPSRAVRACPAAPPPPGAETGRAPDRYPGEPGAALLAAGVEEGLVEARDVAGRSLLHPLPPLRASTHASS